MPAPATRRLTCLVIASAAALATLSPSPALASSAGVISPVAPSVAPAGCEVPLLERATRGSAVKAALGNDLTAAARANHMTVDELAADAATDRTLWLDKCGHIFFVEPANQVGMGATASGDTAPAATAQAGTQAGAPTDPGALSSALTLESKPGSTKTIYLDFNGGTVSGTGWNDTYTAGAPIIAAPYSITAPADTNFSDAELTEIQKAWQVVAEDYAPFDVNVTTKPPPAGAIDRSSLADLTYGTRVLITDSGPICSCGGVAYVGKFGQGAYYQPAWVYTNGSGTLGKTLGEAAAHEAGHNLGLHHDGTVSPASSYYAGAPPWAPIMGSAYDQPVSQFSHGEYPGASNSAEDDLAVISTYLDVRVDDHANTRLGATLLSSTPLDGVIATRTDTDAFTFVASGTTTLTATPGPGFPDLDIGLRILNSTGGEVTYINPPASAVNFARATGLDATWTASLPSTPTTYTAIVDGVGSGDPATAGKYSDYGSLGNFRITLNTPPAALSASSTTPAPGTAGVAYSATPASANGGTPPYSWTATTALPPGLTLDPASATLSGTPTTPGSTSVTLQVTDAAANSASTSFTVTVQPAPVGVPAQSFTPVVDASFSAQLTATGGSGTYTWTSGSLPAGLTLASTGALSGVPKAAGTYTVSVRAVSGSQSGTGTLTLTIDNAPAQATPAAASELSAAAVTIATKSRTSFSTQLVASGGTGAYTWTATGSPAGVTVSSTGLVAGSVGLPGTYSFPATVTSGLRTATTTVTLSVVRQRPLAFVTPKRLLSGHVGHRYKTVITTRGAEGKVTWKKSGKTPPGLRLVPRKSGRIVVAGLPSAPGTYVFKLVVTDATGARRARRFTLSIIR